MKNKLKNLSIKNYQKKDFFNISVELIILFIVSKKNLLINSKIVSEEIKKYFFYNC